MSLDLKEILYTVIKAVEDGHLVVLHKGQEPLFALELDDKYVFNNIIFTSRVPEGAIAIVSRIDKDNLLNEAIRKGDLVLPNERTENDIQRHTNRSLN